MDWIKVAAWMGLITVALGAFGAHGLQETLERTGKADAFRTAVIYQMFHVAGILVVGLILRGGGQPDRWLACAPWAFLSGIVLFSGSLYLLAVTGKGFFGAITPVGGLLFLAGWLGLALGGIVSR